eukprot:scaffold53546_cov34-Cyclotella_meneghiniana.AAC.3
MGFGITICFSGVTTTGLLGDATTGSLGDATTNREGGDSSSKVTLGTGSNTVSTSLFALVFLTNTTCVL